MASDGVTAGSMMWDPGSPWWTQHRPGGQSLHLPPSQGTTLPGMGGGSVSLSERQPPTLAIPSTWICFSPRASALFIWSKSLLSHAKTMLPLQEHGPHMPQYAAGSTVVLGRLLRVPWTARRSYQLILKEINPEYSLEAEAPIFWPCDAKS